MQIEQEDTASNVARGGFRLDIAETFFTERVIKQ